MRWVDLIREYFPDVTKEEVDYILWECTGFPAFWNIEVDGDTPQRLVVGSNFKSSKMKWKRK